MRGLSFPVAVHRFWTGMECTLICHQYWLPPILEVDFCLLNKRMETVWMFERAWESWWQWWWCLSGQIRFRLLTTICLAIVQTLWLLTYSCRRMRSLAKHEFPSICPSETCTDSIFPFFALPPKSAFSLSHRSSVTAALLAGHCQSALQHAAAATIQSSTCLASTRFIARQHQPWLGLVYPMVFHPLHPFVIPLFGEQSGDCACWRSVDRSPTGLPCFLASWLIWVVLIEWRIDYPLLTIGNPAFCKQNIFQFLNKFPQKTFR